MSEGSFVTVGELAAHLFCDVIGDKNKPIYGIALMRDSNEKMLTIVPPLKKKYISSCNAGVILTKATIGLPFHRTYIITRYNPEWLMARTIEFLIENGLYATPDHLQPLIADNAVVTQNVVIGNNSEIGEETILSPGVVIERNVRIGRNCHIGVNTVIGSNTVIDDNVTIGACCCIGTENYEYCRDDHGWNKTPVVGNVIIHNDVMIGGNTVIEKGTIGSTEIGAFSQIGNLVEIAHEVVIGRNCHIVPCVALAGWCEIGDNVEIYAQSGISNRVKIGNNAIVMAKSGVTKNVDEYETVSGFPAQLHFQELKFQAYLHSIYRKHRKEKDVK